MNKWIKIKDRLPKHLEAIYVYTEKGDQFVCLFLDGQRVVDDLVMMNVLMPDIHKSDYYFCSRETPGNYITTASHWMPLFKGPTDD